MFFEPLIPKSAPGGIVLILSYRLCEERFPHLSRKIATSAYVKLVLESSLG